MKLSKNSIFGFYCKKAFNWKNILIILVVDNFVIFMFNLFLSPIDGFSLMLITIMLFGVFVIETYLYSLASNKTFLKVQSLNKKSKRKIQVNLFLISILFAWMLFGLFLFFIWLYQYLDILKHTSIAASDEEYIKFRGNSLNWWVFLLYQLNIMIMLLVTFVYFINHFINNKNIIYGIVIVLFTYTIIYGVVFEISISTIFNENESWYWYVEDDNQNKTFFLINMIIIPWEQISSFLKRLILISYKNQTYRGHYFNYHSLGFYSILSWLPYLTSGLFVMIPKIIKSKKI